MLLCTYSSKLLQPLLGVRARLSPSEVSPLLPACADDVMWNGRCGSVAAAAAAVAPGLPSGLPDADAARGATCSRKHALSSVPGVTWSRCALPTHRRAVR